MGCKIINLEMDSREAGLLLTKTGMWVLRFWMSWQEKFGKNMEVLAERALACCKQVLLGDSGGGQEDQNANGKVNIKAHAQGLPSGNKV